jgi:hypothetical protein
MDYLILRDYLRHEQAARRRYSAFKQEWSSRAPTEPVAYRQAKEERVLLLLTEAHQWWMRSAGFAPVQTVAEELARFERPWYVSSGWALDLFLGRVTRVHSDVDVVIARTDQVILQQHLDARGWKFMTPLKGQLEPWPLHMLLEMPRHQIHAHREGSFIDILLSDIEHGVWRYRRKPSVIRTVEQLSYKTDQGIPFLAPEIVLLFKSKNTGHKDRLKDPGDFEKVYTHLEPEGRARLRWALVTTEPTHPWIERLN